MKILIFSDSHGDVDIMCDVVEKENPDMIIHLGDSIADAEQLNNKYPDIKMIKVLGGIDSQKEDEEWIQYTEICGKRFMVTHGQKFFEETTVYCKAQQNMWLYSGNSDVILYGHMHEPFINCCEGKWIMCPGRIGRNAEGGGINPKYGILKINKSGTLNWQFVEVEE